MFLATTVVYCCYLMLNEEIASTLWQSSYGCIVSAAADATYYFDIRHFCAVVGHKLLLID